MEENGRGIEDADAGERTQPALVLPPDFLGILVPQLVANRRRRFRRCRSRMRVRQDVLGCPDTSGALQDSCVAGLARAVFAEEHGHVRVEVDLVALSESVHTLDVLELDQQERFLLLRPSLGSGKWRNFLGLCRRETLLSFEEFVDLVELVLRYGATRHENFGDKSSGPTVLAVRPVNENLPRTERFKCRRLALLDLDVAHAAAASL